MYCVAPSGACEVNKNRHPHPSLSLLKLHYMPHELLFNQKSGAQQLCSGWGWRYSSKQKKKSKLRPKTKKLTTSTVWQDCKAQYLQNDLIITCLLTCLNLHTAPLMLIKKNYPLRKKHCFVEPCKDPFSSEILYL